MSNQPLLWPQQEAKRLIERWPNKDLFVLETGFGPSGHPHMGTIGEVVRTYYVGMALKELGKDFKIVVFSDDMDGLRKIPVNIDAPWLQEHLGKPVSRIPDPYGCCDSFSGHMNNQLNDMLGRLGVPYEFASSAVMYGSGRFNEAITQAFRHIEELRELIASTMREENRGGWFPFMPICENCGKVNTTVVTGYDTERVTVSYTCTGEHKGVKGCGHTGERSALNGGGKMGWKVDWGLRWYALGVNFEMYGKDLIESAKLSTQVCKTLGGAAPNHMFYELFLTEEGRKISKSVGKGLSLENWDRWGTLEALNLLMFKNPRQQKKLGIDTVIQYMDESLQMAKDAPEYRFIYFTGDRPDLPVRYSDLITLVNTVGVAEPEVLRPFVERTLGVETVSAHWSYIRDLLEKAVHFYEDFIAPHRVIPSLSPEQWAMVGHFEALVERESDPDVIQNSVFQIARDNGMQPKDYFQLLYSVMLGQPQGPRMGNFVKLVGPEKIKEILTQAKAAARA